LCRVEVINAVLYVDQAEARRKDVEEETYGDNGLQRMGIKQDFEREKEGGRR